MHEKETFLNELKAVRELLQDQENLLLSCIDFIYEKKLQEKFFDFYIERFNKQKFKQKEG